MEDDDHADLDDLTRDELAERDGPGHAVATVLDEWLGRLHGITSGQHGAGLFLDLLAAEGYRVERADAPRLENLLAGPPRFGLPTEPVRVTYMSGATDEEIALARLAAIERAVQLLDERGGGTND